MRPFVAIAWKTIQSAIRSRVVHVLLFFLLLSALLPLTIAYDGTAQGLVQVTLTYSLSLAMILLSLSTVWLGCTVIADDVEAYTAHMVLTKPVSRITYWFGRWAGLVVMHGVLLAVAAGLALLLMDRRLEHANFSELELQELHETTLVGRQVYPGVMIENTADGTIAEIDVEAAIRAEYQRRLSMGLELTPGMTEDMVLDTLRRELKGKLQGILPGHSRMWEFRDLPILDDEEVMFFRYRVFVDTAKNRDQRATQGIWTFEVAGEEGGVSMPMEQRGGVFYNEVINPHVTAEGTDTEYHLIDDDGTMRISYTNYDMMRESVVFQPADGPMILITRTGFAMNYARAIFLLFLELVFLATLSCLAGALMSTPVAIFLSYTYVVMGAVVQAMEPATPEDAIAPNGGLDTILWGIRQIIGLVAVSVNEFNRVTSLAKGELIMFNQVFAGDFLLSLLRLILLLAIAAICLWSFKRRELGLVVRK